MPLHVVHLPLARLMWTAGSCSVFCVPGRGFILPAPLETLSKTTPRVCLLGGDMNPAHAYMYCRRSVSAELA